MSELALTVLLIALLWLLIVVAERVRPGVLSRRGVEVKPPLLIWRRPVTFSWARRLAGSRLAGLALDIAAIASAICALLFYYYTGSTVVMRLSGVPASETGGLIPLIPGLTVTWRNIAYILIAFSIAIVVHEVSHGVAAVVEGVGVRSSGLLLLAVIPGAFVEVDENEFSRARLRSRLRILGAGSAANLVVALVLLPLVASGTSGLVVVTDVKAGSPAYRAGIIPGSEVLLVNGTGYRGLGQLLALLNEAKEAGTPFNMTLRAPDGRVYNATIGLKPGETLVGVCLQPMPGPPFDVLPRRLGWEALLVVLWVFNLNLGLAIVNAAPIFVLDGGRMLTEVLTERLGGLGRDISLGIQAVTLMLLLGSIYLPSA